MDYGHRLMKSGVLSLETLDLDQILQSEQASLRKSKIGYFNSYFTLIPKSEFEVQQIEKYVTSACEVADPHNYIYRSDYIVSRALRVCYAVPKGVLAQINDTFDNSSLVHLVTGMIEKLQDEQDILSCHVIDAHILICAVRDTQLVLANAYEVSSAENMLYFISLIYQETGLSDLNAKIKMSGDIEKHSELSAILGNYFGQLELDQPPIFFEDGKMEDSHRYAGLYAISQCA